MKKILTISSIMLICNVLSFAQDKLIPMRVDGKYGYGYQEGILIIGAKYDDALYFEDGLAPVKIGEKWGYINEQGATVISFKFDYASIFDNNNAAVASMGADGKYKYGLINKSGTIIVPCKYESISNMEEGMAAVVINDKYGFINSKGILVIQAKYQSARDFVGGLVAVQLDNKWGFIDKKGTELVPAKYDAVVDFKGGMAIVSIDKKYGYINEKGVEVIPCKYDNITGFVGVINNDSVAVAELDGDKYGIDKAGVIVEHDVKKAPKAIELDSIVYSGVCNGKPLVSFNNDGYKIKSATINDQPVSDTYHDIVDINLSDYKLSRGAKVTVKLVYIKGATMRMVPGGGIDVEQGDSGAKKPKKKFITFGKQ